MACLALLAGHGPGRLRPRGAGHRHSHTDQDRRAGFRRVRGHVRRHHFPGGRGPWRALHRAALGQIRPAQTAGRLRGVVLTVHHRRCLRPERGGLLASSAAGRARLGRLPPRRLGVHERLRPSRIRRQVHHPDHDRLPRWRRGNSASWPFSSFQTGDSCSSSAALPGWSLLPFLWAKLPETLPAVAPAKAGSAEAGNRKASEPAKPQTPSGVQRPPSQRPASGTSCRSRIPWWPWGLASPRSWGCCWSTA